LPSESVFLKKKISDELLAIDKKGNKIFLNGSKGEHGLEI